MVFHLESNYFAQPKKLFLKADGVRALDKDKREVVIDARKGTLIKAPDSRLRLAALRQNGDAVGLDFLLVVDEIDAHRHISLGSELTDDLGNQYEYRSGSSSSTQDAAYVQTYSDLYKRTTSKGMPSLYKFTLSSYPTRLSGGFSVQVK